VRIVCCAPQPSGRFVGRLSADALEEMLRECPPQATLSLHAEGTAATEHGPAVDAFRSAVARGAAAIVASEDAVPPEARLTDNPVCAMRAAEQRMSAGLIESGTRANAAHERIMIAQHQASAEMDACEDEFGPEHFQEFLALRAHTEGARHAAAERAAALAEEEAQARADAAADAARAAAAAAGQFDDAEEEEAEPAATDAAATAEAAKWGINAATFSLASAGDAIALAALEEAACAKRRAVDLPALQARIRARLASANPVVSSCVRDIFDGFGAEGTPEEGAVRTLLIGHAFATRDALARRDAEQAAAAAAAAGADAAMAAEEEE
jgi:hypothetical protein